MARSEDNLHGGTPDKARAALLLIDVINDLDFPEANQLLRQAMPMAERLAALKERAKRAGMPVIYVNDNFGRWRSDFRSLVEHCLEDEIRGKSIVERLRPDEDDYFVLKPRHSGFFSTSLELLLDHVGAETLLITGIATNICVLFTASDAFLRGYQVIVPADCVAANTPGDTQQALEQIRTILKASTPVSDELSIEQLLQGDEDSQGKQAGRPQLLEPITYSS
jgi:nicotinamidase-related amidase